MTSEDQRNSPNLGPVTTIVLPEHEIRLGPLSNVWLTVQDTSLDRESFYVNLWVLQLRDAEYDIRSKTGTFQFVGNATRPSFYNEHRMNDKSDFYHGAYEVQIRSGQIKRDKLFKKSENDDSRDVSEWEFAGKVLDVNENAPTT